MYTPYTHHTVNPTRYFYFLAAASAIVLALSPSASAQTGGPTKEAAKDARRQAAVEFNAANNGRWEIRWDDEAGAPATLFGGRVTDFAGTPAQAAKAFLRANKGMFGIKDADRNLRLDRNTSDFGASQVLYQQVYEGVPVLHSGYLVVFDPSGAITYVDGSYYPDLSVDTKPALSAAAASVAARAGLQGRSEVSSGPDLVVYVDGAPGTVSDGRPQSYHLAYRLKVEVGKPVDEAWEYVVDAHTGTILRKVSLLEHVGHAEPAGRIDGSGQVYVVHPNYAGLVTVPLHRLLNISPRKLDGDNVLVDNYSYADATSSTGSFIYDPSNPNFDDVMAYYHSDEFEAWLVGKGLPQTKVAKVTIRTRYPGVYASTYSSTREIRYGSASGELRNPTLEAAVVTHEYMHVVSETYNTLTQNDYADAMDESYSDYFAVAQKNAVTSSSVIGEYIDSNGTVGCNYARNLINNYNYKDFATINVDQCFGTGEHDRSNIFSGALWDFRRDPDVNASLADQIVLSSLGFLGSSPTFFSGLGALKVAASNAGRSDYIDDIEEAFAKHGIWTASISGPSQVQIHQTNTWTASVTGDLSAFTFAWSAYYSAGGWSTLNTTGRTLTVAFHSSPGPTQIKVAVTRDGRTVEVTKPITVSGGSGGTPYAAGPGGAPPEVAQASVAAAVAYVNALSEPAPNPFGGSTKIRFSLAEPGPARLVVYDVLGREVVRLADGDLPAGEHEVTLSATGAGLSPGTYLYRLEAATSGGPFIKTGRMTVAR